MEKNKIQICKTCSQQINTEWGTGFTVNAGIEGKEYVECELCHENSLDTGRITICENCGEYFSADVLKSEEVCGETFCSCPACGHDVVEGMSRKEYEEEYGPGVEISVPDKMTLKVNNCRQIVLEQAAHDGAIAVTIWSAPDKGGNRGCEAEYTISAGDFVSLLNWYRYQKEHGNEGLMF